MVSRARKVKLIPQTQGTVENRVAPDSPTFIATPKQDELVKLALRGDLKFICMGGGIRGTKTIAMLTLLVILCKIFPRSRWAIVRRDLPTLRRNILPSMNKVRAWAGGFVGELNQGTWTYTCANGSVLILFAEQFQQDSTLERWKGLEVNGFLLEEASELAEASANKSIERAGSWIIPPAQGEHQLPPQPPPFVFATVNPCPNWPRKWWYEPWKAGTIKPPYAFLPSTIADNPFASEEYKDSLTFLPAAEYDRFVKGEWEFTDDPDQLIQAEWVWQARDVEPIPGPEFLGVDVARYGDDATTVARIRGNTLVRIQEYRHLPTDRVATIVLNEAAGAVALDPTPVAGENVRIDGVGLGAGVVDFCRSKNLPVVDFIAGAKAVERKVAQENEDGDNTSVLTFANLRSQMWWEFREKLRKHQFSFSIRDKQGNELPVPEKLVADLCAPRYRVDDKVIKVESKDTLKLRLGRSPDYGDAVVMAAFDLPPRASVFVL